MKHVLFSEYVNQQLITTKPCFLSEDNDHRYSISIPFNNRENGVTAIVIMKNPSAAGKIIELDKKNKMLSDDTIYNVLDYLYKLSKPVIKKVIIVNLMSVYSGTLSNVIKHSKGVLELSSVENLNEIRNILKNKNEKDIIIAAWGGYPKYPQKEKPENIKDKENKKIKLAPYRISQKELKIYYDDLINEVNSLLKNESNVFLVGSLNKNNFPPHGKNWYDYEKLDKYILPDTL
jgi:trehalose-6-phosphate synthase